MSMIDACDPLLKLELHPLHNFPCMCRRHNNTCRLQSANVRKTLALPDCKASTVSVEFEKKDACAHTQSFPLQML
eukprot:1866122-Amphidinium_carterae.1